jgi:hypothetical protein
MQQIRQLRAARRQVMQDGRPGHWRIFRVGEGLQAEIPAGVCGLQIGDRILKIGGKGPSAGPPQRNGYVPLGRACEPVPILHLCRGALACT